MTLTDIGPDMGTIHEKIRKLFALAEGAGTTQEAELATAKAMAMLLKYDVDLAMLAAKRPGRGKPSSRTIKIKAPHARPKAVLLTCIGPASNVKMVWTSATGEATIVGFESDLDTVELLFASLTLQGLAAALRAAQDVHLPGGGEHRSFMVNFLNGFASRVKARLTEARRTVVNDTPGSELVLRDRGAEVATAFAEMYPRLGKASGSRVTNRSANQAGRAAADRADLGQTKFRGSSRALAS